MADGTLFERRGVVAASIVTTPFMRTGDSMARRQGYPGYRYADMPHPIGNLRPEQIRERARDVLPRVLELLGLPQHETPS